MPYTNEGNIEKLLLHDIDSSFSTQISTWITVAQEWIDNYCGTTFDQASATKYYDGNGSQDLAVDEFEGSATVKLLDTSGNITETLTEGTDFLSYPLNTTAKHSLSFVKRGGLASDRDLIDVEDGVRLWPKGTKSVQVTATFGRSAVPKSVELAASMIVARIISEGLRGGQVKAEQLGSYSVTYKDIDDTAAALGIKSLLQAYRVMDI